jgi:hypothetical protein
VWWVFAGIGFAGATALLVAVFLFDAEPPGLVLIALPLYGVALGVARHWLKGRSGFPGTAGP